MAEEPESGDGHEPDPGREPASQAERSARTRARILAAAHEAFAAHGFGDANIEAIAAAAAINKRMVYHHFGGKDELFAAVLENAYARMREAEGELHLERLEPLAAIRRLIGFTWDYYLENADFLKLVGIENLMEARHIRGSDRINALSSQLVRMAREVVARGQAAGVFRRDLDPTQVWISISALCWFSVANSHTLSVTFDQDMLAPAARDRRLAHIVDMVTAHLVGPDAGRLPENFGQDM